MEKERFKKAAEIIKAGVEGIKFPIELYRFGVYEQYEVAGGEVNPWDEWEFYSEYNVDIGTDKRFCNELSFLNKEWIKEQGHDMYGQNVLMLTEDGRTYVDSFSI